jgi:hypothetical protein
MSFLFELPRAILDVISGTVRKSQENKEAEAETCTAEVEVNDDNRMESKSVRLPSGDIIRMMSEARRPRSNE